MEILRYAPLTDEVKAGIINYLTLKLGSTESSLLEAQAKLGKLRSSTESPQPQNWRRRIIMVFDRLTGEPSIEERLKRAENTVTLVNSEINRFESLVVDAQEGRVDRIEAELFKDVEDGFNSLRMRGPGWSPDEDYSGWRRVREAGYLEASQAINLLAGVNPVQALLFSVKLQSLADKCLSPNYD